ncbi:MAG: hypothetical protein ACE5GA_02175 [Candidatus Zixiibacteriota bacterium]
MIKPSQRSFPMKSINTVRIPALCLIVTALALGCSDSSTNSQQKLTGDPADLQFGSVSEQLDDAALNFAAIEWLNPVMDSIPGLSPRLVLTEDPRLARRAGAAIDTVLTISISIDSATYWIVFQATVTNFIDTASVVDSFRFSGVDGPELPINLGDTATGMDVRAHARVVINDTTAFTGIIASHVSFSADIIGRGDPILGGDTTLLNVTGVDTLSGTATDSGAACTFTITTNRIASGIVSIDSPTYPCPIAGNINASMDLNFACALPGMVDSVSVNGSWVVTATYNPDGSASMTYENATTRWTGVVPCEPVPLAGSLANVHVRPLRF